MVKEACAEFVAVVVEEVKYFEVSLDFVVIAFISERIFVKTHLYYSYTVTIWKVITIT